MHFGHAEGRVPAKALESVHHRLRLLSMDFRVGSFWKLPPVFGQPCNADRDKVSSERVVGSFLVGPTSRGYTFKRLPSPHGIFDAQCFLIWTSHSASLEQATSPLGVTAHASCTRCTSLAPTPMFENPCQNCSMA